MNQGRNRDAIAGFLQFVLIFLTEVFTEYFLELYKYSKGNRTHVFIHRFRVVNFIDILQVIKKNNGFVVQPSSDVALREAFQKYFMFLDNAYNKVNNKMKEKRMMKKSDSMQLPYGVEIGKDFFVSNILILYSLFMVLLDCKFFALCDLLLKKNLSNNTGDNGMKAFVVHSWYCLFQLKFTLGDLWRKYEEDEKTKKPPEKFLGLELQCNFAEDEEEEEEEEKEKDEAVPIDPLSPTSYSDRMKQWLSENNKKPDKNTVQK